MNIGNPPLPPVSVASYPPAAGREVQRFDFTAGLPRWPRPGWVPDERALVDVVLVDKVLAGSLIWTAGGWRLLRLPPYELRQHFVVKGKTKSPMDSFASVFHVDKVRADREAATAKRLMVDLRVTDSPAELTLPAQLVPREPDAVLRAWKVYNADPSHVLELGEDIKAIVKNLKVCHGELRAALRTVVGNLLPSADLQQQREHRFDPGDLTPVEVSGCV